MNAQYDYEGAAAPEHDEYVQGGWYGFADSADVPEIAGAWTLKDFADILPPHGEWQ